MDRVTGHTRITGVMEHVTVTGQVFNEAPGYVVIYGAIGDEAPRDFLFTRAGLEIERNVEAVARVKDRHAIPAHDLRDGDILLGDSVSPERYGEGVRVQAVNDEVPGCLLVIADGRAIELNAAETVWIRPREAKP